jgi:uncharacterized protein (TIGR03086 family)
MQADLLDLYRRGSQWTAEKVAAARDLEAATPCPGWRVRDLLNHMLDTQQYFAGAARGEDAAPPAPSPPSLLTVDPSADFARATAEVMDAYSQDGVIERTGPALGIAFSDQLPHGWDLARATKQDATLPDGLAQAAYDCIHGRFTDEQRKGMCSSRRSPSATTRRPSSDSSHTRGASRTEVPWRVRNRPARALSASPSPTAGHADTSDGLQDQTGEPACRDDDGRGLGHQIQRCQQVRPRRS